MYHLTWLFFDKCSLVELERPTAYHSTPTFPPHTLKWLYIYTFLDNLAYESNRPGDLARIEENISSSGPSKKATKIKKPEDAATKPKAAEGVVYKVTAISIILILSA